MKNTSLVASITALLIAGFIMVQNTAQETTQEAYSIPFADAGEVIDTIGKPPLKPIYSYWRVVYTIPSSLLVEGNGLPSYEVAYRETQSTDVVVGGLDFDEEAFIEYIGLGTEILIYQQIDPPNE